MRKRNKQVSARKKTGIVLAAVLLAAGIFGGCGMKMSQEGKADTAGMGYDYENGMADEAYEEKEIAESGAVASSSLTANIADSSRKLIKDVTIDAETKKFDDTLKQLYDKIAEVKGYVQSSDISGTSYLYTQNRYGTLTIRIPADKLDEFINCVSEIGNVTNSSESVRDVTLDYVDTETHLKALRVEQETLTALLEKAETLEDVFAIQSRLTEIRYEIETYESTLRTYDQLVAYSTVNLNLREVEKVTETKKEGFGEEVLRRLENNLYHIGQGIRAFSIWFIGSLPYILPIAAAVIVAIFTVKKKTAKKKGKKAEPEEKK